MKLNSFYNLQFPIKISQVFFIQNEKSNVIKEPIIFILRLGKLSLEKFDFRYEYRQFIGLFFGNVSFSRNTRIFGILWKVEIDLI